MTWLKSLKKFWSSASKCGCKKIRQRTRKNKTQRGGFVYSSRSSRSRSSRSRKSKKSSHSPKSA